MIRPKVASRPGCTRLPPPPESHLPSSPERIAWFEPGVVLCTAAGLDPWGTLASGTLLAGFAPDRLDGALNDLACAGYATSIIGRAGRGYGVALAGGTPLTRFERDELSRLSPALAGP